LNEDCAPLWADFENFDALPRNAVADIQIATNMRRWPAFRQESIERFLYAFLVEVVKETLNKPSRFSPGGVELRRNGERRSNFIAGRP
jgi:hypothetical protein